MGFKFIIVASHRRSGTHWVIDSIFNNFKDVSHGYLNLNRLLPDHDHRLKTEVFRKCSKKKKIVILKTHADGDFEVFRKFPRIDDFVVKESIPSSKIINVTRDDRDILNSLFYYLKAMDINYHSFSEFLRSSNNFDNMYPEMNRVEYLKYHQDSWKKRGNKIDLDYADLAGDYSGAIKKISDYIGLEHIEPVTEVELKKYNKLERALRRIFPPFFKTTAVLPRDGKVGGWKSNFSDDDLEFYHSIMKNRK